MARSNFDFDKLTVVAEVLVGSETMFIWDAPTRAGIQRNAFYIGLDQKNQLRLSAVSSNSPVEPLILNAFVAARRIRPCTNHFEYQRGLSVSDSTRRTRRCGCASGVL